MKERNQYVQLYETMSPIERMAEMRSIYNFVPHVDTFVKPPEEITPEERARRFERFEVTAINSVLEELSRDPKDVKRIRSAMEERSKSQLKSDLTEGLQTLMQYSHFTPSGSRYVVTTFEDIFVNGIELDTKDPSSKQGIFAILYKWKDVGDGGIFNKHKAQELERLAYQNAVGEQLLKNRAIQFL
ncbi:MAG: hypothetical protein AAB583_02185, partial [Patescibacteria group bacterium]